MRGRQVPVFADGEESGEPSMSHLLLLTPQRTPFNACFCYSPIGPLCRSSSREEGRALKFRHTLRRASQTSEHRLENPKQDQPHFGAFVPIGFRLGASARPFDDGMNSCVPPQEEVKEWQTRRGIPTRDCEGCGWSAVDGELGTSEGAAGDILVTLVVSCGTVAAPWPCFC